MSTEILIISGKQGSGKTTLQKEVSRRWNNYSGHRAMTLNFADPIYEIHDFSWNLLRRYGFELSHKKDGRLMQLIGTEWGRENVDTDLWVKIAQKKIQKGIPGPVGYHPKALWIIGDCRFENEFDAFPEALKVRLECPEVVRKVRASMWREATGHPSEVGLDGYANQGKFDLLFDTETQDVNSCAEVILKKLLD